MTEESTQTLPVLTGKWFGIGQQFLESTARNIQPLGAGSDSLQEACAGQFEAARSAILKMLDFQRAILEEWKRETSKLPSEPNSYAVLADVVEKGLETQATLWRAWFQTAQHLPLSAEILNPWRPLAEAMTALQKAGPDTASPASVQSSDEDSNPSRRSRAPQRRGN